MTQIDEQAQKGLIKLINNFKKKGIKYVIVGAQVPIILADNKDFGCRETKDIDSAISLKNWDEYEQLKKQLIKQGFTTKTYAPEHKLYYGNTEIDLLPVIGNIVKSNYLTWPISKQTMSTFGFEEALKFAIEVKISPSHKIKVAPIWAFILLKFFSYHERKFDRDAIDIVNILSNYGNDDRKFELAPHDIDYSTAGAYLCGYDICNLGNKNTVKLLKKCLVELLSNNNYSDIITSVLHEKRIVDNEREREKLFSLFKSFEKGLKAD